jgi:hypothetical protein
MEEGEATKIPMLFSMTDYGGKVCRTKINILDIEGGKITEDWTRVRIPLQAFNYYKNDVNMSNIKDLRLDLQKSGDVHIDAMKVVKHHHPFPNHHLNPAQTVYRPDLPLTLGENPDSWWGVNEARSANFKFQEASESDLEQGGHNTPASQTLLVNYKKGDDDGLWNDFGFAMHDWEKVDFYEHHRTAALRFRMKTQEVPKMQISFVSSKGPRRMIQTRLKPEHIRTTEEGMCDVIVPIKSFPFFEELNWSVMQEVRFKLLASANFEMSQIELTEFRGNPQNPTKWKSR